MKLQDLYPSCDVTQTLTNQSMLKIICCNDYTLSSIKKRKLNSNKSIKLNEQFTLCVRAYVCTKAKRQHKKYIFGNISTRSHWFVEHTFRWVILLPSSLTIPMMCWSSRTTRLPWLASGISSTTRCYR